MLYIYRHHSKSHLDSDTQTSCLESDEKILNERSVVLNSCADLRQGVHVDESALLAKQEKFILVVVFGLLACFLRCSGASPYDLLFLDIRALFVLFPVRALFVVQVLEGVVGDFEDLVESGVLEERLAVNLSIAIAQQANDVPLFLLGVLLPVLGGRGALHEIEDASESFWCQDSSHLVFDSIHRFEDNLLDFPEHFASQFNVTFFKVSANQVGRAFGVSALGPNARFRDTYGASRFLDLIKNSLSKGGLVFGLFFVVHDYFLGQLFLDLKGVFL